jgi:hypothetical protein
MSDSQEDDFERYIAPGASRHEHTLTVTETGETFITEHSEDPGFTLLSGCYMFKVAHRAFEKRTTRPIDNPLDPNDRPAPGVYRIHVGTDGNLEVFGRIADLTDRSGS